MQGLHCCQNTAMRTGTQQAEGTELDLYGLGRAKNGCFCHRLCVQTTPACAEDESLLRH